MYTDALRDTHLLVKVIHFFVRSTKGGKNDYIAFSNRIKILSSILRLFNKLHLHILELIVDFGVVDEFVGNVYLFTLEMIDGFVGQGNGSFDTPAKAKVLQNKSSVMDK